MSDNYDQILKSKTTEEHYRRLMDLKNPKLHRWIAESIELCQPDSLFVCTDSAEDVKLMRTRAKEIGEEKPLKMDGHTYHFDGYHDQGRDKDNTFYLVPDGVELGKSLNSMKKKDGVAFARELLGGSMKGRSMILRFFSLGPVNSEFSLSGVQLTDSYYVAHSEDLLYRAGYEQFKKIGGSNDYFRVLHSAGKLSPDKVSASPDKRRILIDIEDEMVYSVNTQYAGNTVGFKKLSLRLAIRKADREGWLSEHMLVMGVHDKKKNRVTYFSGAFPSYCGKTSTAMVLGETIVGDDLAYLRRKNDRVYGVNVECGIFGIIENVNGQDDPAIWKVLTAPGEVIFSNILISDGVPYWSGDKREHPKKGVNFSGEWDADKKDENAKSIPPSHKNARYTIRLRELDNIDPKADDPNGVPIDVVIYGGRNSRTWVPVKQSFDWAHGVVTMGGSLESETTAATLGAEGLRVFNPMSNLDFLSIPLGKYIQNHLDFVKGIKYPPKIFAVNYFMKDTITGEYLNGMQDKRIWLKWMQLRIYNEVEAVRVPDGFIPKYEDLKILFKEVLDKEYSEQDYIKQFTTRIPENLNKIARIEEIYHTGVPDTPKIFFDIMSAQHKRFVEAIKKHGDYPSPLVFCNE